MKNGENSWGFPGLWWFRRLSVYLQCRGPGFDPWVRKIPWRKKWQSTPVLLPGKSHGQRSLVGYSPWCRKESDTTELLHFHLNFYTKTTYVFCRKCEWLSCVWLFVTPWIHSPWNSPGQNTGVGSLSLREGNGTPLQYSCLENPWTEEPGRLQSMGLLRVGHDWANSLSLFTFMHCRRKWHPTPVFLPGESQGRGSLVGCHLWGRTESDTTEAT